MPEFLSQSSFWFSVLQIIAIDILLGGDNAVVVALACRKLPESQRNKGIAWGVAGAIGLRIALISFALQLLALPFIKIVGAMLLLWIGIKLLQASDEEPEIDADARLFGAIKTIIIADAVMSVDNVIAVAGAAKGDLWLVVFGIVVSIPIIVFGSKFVLTLMERFPVVITLGAALLGWIAGDMFMDDVVLKPYLVGTPHALHYLSAVIGACLVVFVGKEFRRRSGA